MTAQTRRLIRLLDRGYYPAEIPPPFSTRRFSDVRVSLAAPNGYAGSTTYFDGATFRGALRKFGVVNPVNYMLLSRFIAANWTSIKATYDLSSCSGARPKFSTQRATGRAVHSASLAAKRSGQAHLASMYPVILSVDINRFYGSIYTHSIPWAALGKTQAKTMYANNTLNTHWSNELDRLARNCNQRQTIGLAIGPDTSRIISEMILSRLDFELTNLGNLRSRQVYHNIDDYQIGCLDVSAAENAQSLFVRALAKYELRINDFKTSIDHGLQYRPSNFQRFFDILSNVSGRNFVEHFFEILYQLDHSYPQLNVIGYALKRFARILARNPEKNLVREYLQRLLFAAPHQARWILPLLLGFYRHQGLQSDGRRLIRWGLQTCARRNDAGSLVWYLYAALFLDMNLTNSDCVICIGLENPLIDLMLFHGRNKGIFSFSLSLLRTRYLTSVFSSDSWIVLYEVENKGWDTFRSFSKIGTTADPNNLYSHLQAKNVEFYITDATYFAVEAFTGWNLRQADFAEERNAPGPFDFREILGDVENYE